MGGWNFAPVGWNFCDGTLLPISEFEALYTLIGTTYGGDGISTFALPDLRGRVPVHQGTGFIAGQRAGAEAVTLTTGQTPVHTHPFAASTNAGSQKLPTANVVATLATSAGSAYVQTPPTAALAPQSIGQAYGGSQPHGNMQPFLGITFIIALYGIFPSQS